MNNISNARAMAVLQKIGEICERNLSENLVGVYAHGSLTLGGFRWESSDVDYLVVTRETPSLAQKEALLRDLLALDACCPPKGQEMSVVLERYCRHFVHPTPFELHYSNAHRECCQKDMRAYCRNMHGTDGDLAAHFTVARSAGKTIVGKPIREVFGPVPKRDYLDSIMADVREAPEKIEENPAYYGLNLCRVLAYVWDQRMLSKEQAGAWGLERLPDWTRGAVSFAAARYAGVPAGAEPCGSELVRFAEYMLSQLEAACRKEAVREESHRPPLNGWL